MFSSATPTVCTVSGSTTSFVGGGTCTVKADQAGNANYSAAQTAFQTFSVTKADQTVAFTSTVPSGATVGGPTYAAAASASSGLTTSITVDASAASVCSISGSTVSFKAAGTCVLDANQPGDGQYNAASQTQQSFPVAATSGTKYDNSHDTVNCAALVGTIKVAPALSPTGGPTATTLTVKATLLKCTDGNGVLNAKGNPAQPAFTGSLAGTLTGNSNNPSALSGCSASSGTLKVTWHATNGAKALVDPTTSVATTQAFGGTFVPIGGGFGIDNVTTGGFRSLSLGKLAVDNGCSPSSQTGGFGGSDSGVTSASYAVTSQDLGAFTANEENNPLGTLSTINLGMGAAYFG
jgi:hypothetical protein